MNASRTPTQRVRRSVLACILGTIMPLLSPSGSAETIAIPLGQQGKAWQIDTPKMGMRKDQVEEQFGQPMEQSGPVGTPPIYTWEYEQFSVYFEGDHVIHAVVKAPRKN